MLQDSTVGRVWHAARRSIADEGSQITKSTSPVNNATRVAHEEHVNENNVKGRQIVPLSKI